MHAEVIQIINDIEKQCDTNALLYRGVSYWPLCRMRLWGGLMQRLVLAKKSDDAVSVSNVGPSWKDVEQVNAAITGSANLGLLRAHKGKTELSLKPQALFFLRPEEYGDKVAGSSYAKILDSVYERAALQGAAAKIELANPPTMAFARRYPSLFLYLEAAGRDVAYDPPGTLENFDAVAAAVAARNVGITLDRDALTADMGKVFYFARIFEKILRALGPRALFLSVYYHPVGMAWMLACRWAGVTSVDVQHGRLGPYHGNYTQLIAAPPEGYHMLPDFVWCWGEQTKHDIDVDRNPDCSRHGGRIGGNPWLSKWRYGDTTGLEPPEAADFAARAAGRRCILVSLQPLESPVTPELLQTMQQSPPDWLWLLRLHPLRKHTAPEIEAILRHAGIQNAEIEQATALPLFSLLRLVSHHVTVFSSVAVEAAAFGIRTSLLGAEGPSALAPQIKRGICTYTPTTERLLANIREKLSTALPPVTDDFITMQEGIVDQALERLIR